MTTYKIKTTSWVLWIVTLLTTLFGGVILAIIFLPRDKTVTILAVILILVLTIFLQRFVSLGQVRVSLTDSKISINWDKQYIFHRRPNLQIPLSDVESYKYQPDQNFDLFKVTLKNGNSIRLWHFTFTSGDDFDKLVTDFSKVVDVYNRQKQVENNSKEIGRQNEIIKKARTIYESDAAPFLAAFAIIMIIAVPIIIYMKPPDKTKNPFLLLGSMAGAIFFLTQFWKYRKQKMNKK